MAKKKNERSVWTTWENEPSVFDIYWYCLTKNNDYIKDYLYIKSDVLPVLQESQCYSENKNNPQLMGDPLACVNSLEDCFDMSSVSSEFIREFTQACSTYYGFIYKWRVHPTDYSHELRIIDEWKSITVYKRNEIVFPSFIDIEESVINFPESLDISVASDHYTLKQVQDSLSLFLEEYKSNYSEELIAKNKNKTPSFDIVKRAIISFDLLFKHQYDLSSIDTYRQFTEENKVFIGVQKNAKDFFNKKNNHDSIWPDSVKDVYKRYNYIINEGEENKLSKQRASDFNLALKFLSNPHWLLSIFPQT